MPGRVILDMQFVCNFTKPYLRLSKPWCNPSTHTIHPALQKKCSLQKTDFNLVSADCANSSPFRWLALFKFFSRARGSTKNSAEKTLSSYCSKFFAPRLSSQYCTELAKKVCPRLRDLTTAPAGGITQPRTKIFGQFCTVWGVRL